MRYQGATHTRHDEEGTCPSFIHLQQPFQTALIRLRQLIRQLHSLLYVLIDWIVRMLEASHPDPRLHLSKER